MTAIDAFLAGHPLVIWAGFGAILLALELVHGSGWLLWPAGSAFALAAILLVFPAMGAVTQVLVYAFIAILSTVIGRKVVSPRARLTTDVNEPMDRLVGMHGQVIAAFQAGHGRVFVDGKEWAAESAAPLQAGAEIVVEAVLGGARLKVR
jgi:inner membrane protein